SGQSWVAMLLLALLLAALAMHLPSLKALLAKRAHSAPALLLLVCIAVPPVVAVTRFGFFVSEPRYALPLYAGVPLLAAALWRVGSRPAAAVALGVVAFNA